MRNGFLATVSLAILTGTPAFGQAPPAPAPEAGGSCARDLSVGPGWGDAGPGDGWGRVTLSADYLLWWVRKGPSPGPLLTTGSAGDAIPGALGQLGTRTLFGGDGFDYPSFSGFRLDGSVGLGSGLALDGSYFVLERRSVGISAGSDANGNPLIARPVINDINGQQQSYSTSFPGGFAGQSDIVSHSQLGGYEINLAGDLARCDGHRLAVLAGFRYLSLREDLQFHDGLTPLTANFLTFDGPPVNPPSTLADFDGFTTRNRFYGGQVGARWEQSFGPLDLSLTGKVALGGTEQRETIVGVSVLNTPGAAPTVAPGGILAQTSNSGGHSRAAFAVVPELGLNVGWQITTFLSARVGYTFLYWSEVVRPGARIDPRVNPFVVPTDQNFGGGPATGHPAFGFHSSDFWAQGINVGMTLRF